MHLYHHATAFIYFLVGLFPVPLEHVNKTEENASMEEEFSFSKRIIYQTQTTDKIISNKYTRKHNTHNVHIVTKQEYFLYI